MRITKKWLESKQACQASCEWYSKQNSTDAKYIFDQALKEGRFYDINWVLTQKMNKRQRVEYSIFAAETVLENFENINPSDKGPREAIEAAKAYLKKPSKKTKSAARSAARSAVWSARSAAWSAESAKSAEFSARSAAWSAWSAAWSAESAWSACEKILKFGYDLLVKYKPC